MDDDSAVVERWLPVVGYEGLYEVSDLGRVRGINRTVFRRNGKPVRLRGMLLAQRPNVHGRLIVSFHRDYARWTEAIHRLVLTAFVGVCPEGMEGCHNNGNCADNRLTNLRWDTHLNNLLDKVRHGTDYHRNKKRCPRNHLLVSPNLVVCVLARGHRSCLACARTHANQQKAKARGQLFDFQQVSDVHYELIMDSSYQEVR